MFTSANPVITLLSIPPEKSGKLQNIITLDPISNEDKQKLEARHWKVYSYQEVLNKGDKVKEEWRTYLTMEIKLNKKTIIDTVVYQLTDKALQYIANQHQTEAYIKKGMAFSNESKHRTRQIEWA